MPLVLEGASVDQRIQRAESAVRERFPALGRLRFKVQSGQGPGFAEFFPADEGQNPNPGVPTIEVRRTDLPDRQLQSVILGDALHLAPRAIPEFGDLKRSFVRSLKPEQLAVIRDMFAENVRRTATTDFPERRSFDQFVDQVGADAFIRDFFFQKEGAIPGGQQFVSGVGPIMGTFFEDQIRILERMRKLLQSK